MDRNGRYFLAYSWLFAVALRKESVDRNARKLTAAMQSEKVALRKESVDRNREQFKYVVQCRVALRKESVDRNRSFGLSGVDTVSLSARRAWIEIKARTCYKS